MRDVMREDLAEFLECAHRDSLFLTASWLGRRWPLTRALARHKWDVECVETLAGVLGQTVQLDEWQVIDESVRTLQLLDQLIVAEISVATGLLDSEQMVASLCAAWFVLEIRFPPERGWLQTMRERLTVQAERLEIDLRGLGV